MTIDEQTAAILAQINQHEADPEVKVSITDARIGAHALFTNFSGDVEQGCKTVDRQIKSTDRQIPVRIYYPNGNNRPPLLPMVAFFHGGGWSLGDIESYDSLVRALCVLSGTIYISVDYRLAPEYKYPKGLNDCLDVTRWILTQGEKIGGDISRVAVMGDSAGGNLAAVVAHQCASLEGTKIKAQFLLYPVMDISRGHEYYPSRMTSGNGEYLLSRDGIDMAADWYLTQQDDRSNPAISPARQKDLSLTPSTVIIVGGKDPLLNEAQEYHAKLKASDVPSVLKCYDTTIHAFLSFGILNIAQDARIYIADQIKLRV